MEASHQNQGLFSTVCSGCERPGFKDMSRFLEFQGQEMETMAAEAATPGCVFSLCVCVSLSRSNSVCLFL